MTRPSPRLLVVDDSAEILQVLQRGLVRAGYEVQPCPDGQSALAAFRRERHDLILLDLLLPDVDGIDLCAELREIHDVPIIMLTARDSVAHRVEGLRAGADDYIVKPFALDELVARIEAVLRRRPPGERTMTFEDITLDLDAHRVTRGEDEVHLTRTEFAMLEAFLRHPGRVISRESLVVNVWPDAEFVDDAVTDTHLTNLRRKLEQTGGRRVIQTVRGLGFVLR